MKCTCPTQEICVWDLTQAIFHWLALGFRDGVNANFKIEGNANFKIRFGGNTTFEIRVGGNANFNVFGYQHVGI